MVQAVLLNGRVALGPGEIRLELLRGTPLFSITLLLLLLLLIVLIFIAAPAPVTSTLGTMLLLLGSGLDFERPPRNRVHVGVVLGRAWPY